MKVGIPTETFPGERRVALVPDTAALLKKAGHEVQIERGAGVLAGYSDKAYEEKGATIAVGRAELFSWSEAIFQVRGLGANLEAGQSDLDLMKPGLVIIAGLDPLSEPKAVEKLAAAKVMAFSMELMPRITRAQSMDIMSSMATIAGYKSVLMAADASIRMFPMFMTAAGTVTPARMFIMGVGVAGLQAISMGRRLGAIVKAYDVRPAVKEQVESLGAKFVEMELDAGDAETKGGYAKEMSDEFLRKQRELMTETLAESHVVITTAAIPGRKSPILVTAEMVKHMIPGSVIIDLAAERGGNCELTKAGETVVEHGVTIMGPLNLASTIPLHASQMFSKNLTTFLAELTKDGALALDMENEVLRETLVAHEGEVVHPRIRDLLGLAPNKPAEETASNS